MNHNQTKNPHATCHSETTKTTQKTQLIRGRLQVWFLIAKLKKVKRLDFFGGGKFNNPAKYTSYSMRGRRFDYARTGVHVARWSMSAGAAADQMRLRSRRRTHTERTAVPDLQGVVRRAVIVGVKELLEPLQELKVVLEATLDQLIHRNDLYQHTHTHLPYSDHTD